MMLDAKTVPLLQTELTRLTIITEKIMEYENLTHNSTDDIQIERFAIKKQIETLVHEYSPQIEKTEQRIVVLGDADILIRMDNNMFIQILHNIFSNFIKYAGSETTLICKYSRINESVKLEFLDNGK